MDADQVAPVKPVSASQHSGIDKALKDSFVFETEITKTDGDFVSGGTVNDNFVKTVMQSLKEAKNERHLQDGVFNAMSFLDDIIVPPDSKRQPKEKDMNFLNKLKRLITPTSYQEKDMKEILDLYAEKHFSEMLGENTVRKMKASEPGLFVRATSRPDVSVLQKVTSKDRDVASGEIKNDDQFSVKEALMQEGAYLMLLLYWWRVYAGREVATVYGFALCGPFCRDLKQRKRTWRGKPATGARYCICLMRLSAPAYLGGIPCLTYFKSISSLDDESTVRKLCQFLTKKDLWDKKDAPTINNPCPAWFSLPKNFATKLSERKRWNLEVNGTAAAVFRCFGKEGVWEIMNLTDEKLQSEAREIWSAYLDEKEQEKGEELFFYVKVSTAAIDRSFNPFVLETIRGAATRLDDQDFLCTYPVAQIMSDTCYCVLMADRGTRIKSPTIWTPGKFNQMFGELRKKTVALSEKSHLQHGDIAKHNIVVEKDSNGCERFVLIDWDEARIHPKSRDSQGLIDFDLLHPECLRQKPMLYTTVQLALLYWRLRKEHVDDQSINWAEEESIPGLKEYRDAVQLDDVVSINEIAATFVCNAERARGAATSAAQKLH